MTALAAPDGWEPIPAAYVAEWAQAQGLPETMAAIAAATLFPMVGYLLAQGYTDAAYTLEQCGRSVVADWVATIAARPLS